MSYSQLSISMNSIVSFDLLLNSQEKSTGTGTAYIVLYGICTMTSAATATGVVCGAKLCIAITMMMATPLITTTID